MSRPNEPVLNLRSMIRRARLLSKLTSRSASPSGRSSASAASGSSRNGASPKVRAVSAVQKRLERRNSESERKSNKIEGSNLDVKASFKFVFSSFGDLIVWFMQPVNFGPILFCLLGYLYRTIITYSESYLINAAFLLVIPSVAVALVAILFAFERKYTILPDKSKEDSKYWLTEDDILELHRQMPWYFSRPEVDTAYWVNEITQTLWPLIEADAKRSISSALGGSWSLNEVDYIGPSNRYTGFKIVKLSLGKTIPTITGVHVWKRGVRPKEIMLDVHIRHDADLDVAIKGFFKMQGGLDMLSIKILVRIIIGPLYRVKPAISSILLTLLDVPEIDWHFNGFLRFLNAQWIQYLFTKYMFAMFGNPNKYMVKIMKIAPTKSTKLRDPLGVVQVELMDAVNLPRTNIARCCGPGKADAFCVVKIGDEEKETHVIPNNDNPEWHRSFTFLYCGEANTIIDIALYDEDITSDTFIGYYAMSLDKFRTNSEMNGREFSGSLRLPDSSRLVKKGKSKIGFRISYFDLNIQELKSSAIYEKSKLPVAVLTVVIDYATGLETVPKQYQTPESRSMVRVTVGNQTQVTTIKERTGYPVWEEALHFLLHNPHLEDMHVEVIDMYHVMEKKVFILIGKKQKKCQHTDWAKLSDRGILIGWLTIPISNTLTAKDMETKHVYQLDGYTENGFIKIATAMRITQYSQAVIDNRNKPRTVFPDDRQVVPEDRPATKKAGDKRA